MNKRKNTGAVVGASSLLVIFAVLCLTVFALLGLSTVQADRRLSQTSAQAVSDWYQADLEAQRILARLRSGELPEQVSVEGDLYCYRCPITQTQQLCVAVRRSGEEWIVERWQAVYSADWDNDDSLNVWDGATII